jgi:hypothetical protein
MADNKRHHQLSPLVDPKYGVTVEIHRRPNTGSLGRFVTVEQCFADSVESSTGVTGVRAPSPEHHFIFHLAHAWADRPLGRIRDLIDLALLSAELGGPEIARSTSKRFGVSRVWDATVSAQQSILYGQDPKPMVYLLSHHMTSIFNPSKDVFRRFATPLWADSVSESGRIAYRELVRLTVGNPGESFLKKITRTFR